MIDCARWVLAEAWIANGLRVTWGPRLEYTRNVEHDGWQGDATDGFYRYVGHGEWEVPRPNSYTTRPFGEETAPQLSTDTMRHELAHWLIATAEQRYERNFGLTAKDDDAESRAVAAERVIASIIAAASRVVSLSLTSRKP